MILGFNDGSHLELVPESAEFGVRNPEFRNLLLLLNQSTELISQKISSAGATKPTKFFPGKKLPTVSKIENNNFQCFHSLNVVIVELQFDLWNFIQCRGGLSFVVTLLKFCNYWSWTNCRWTRSHLHIYSVCDKRSAFCPDTHSPGNLETLCGLLSLWQLFRSLEFSRETSTHAFVQSTSAPLLQFMLGRFWTTFNLLHKFLSYKLQALWNRCCTLLHNSSRDRYI